MDFEQDYIMRMIKDMVRFFMQLITGKPQFQYDVSNKEHPTPCDDVYSRITAMADSGRINQAENLLYQSLDPDNEDYLLMGLSFYSHINEYTDEFLESSSYSREEIQQGIENFVTEYGIEGLETFYTSSLRLM